MSLEVGIKGTCTVTADESNSAKTMRSGTLDVFATPAMIALMEKTAWTSVAPYLEPGEGTVGIHLDISHDAPTPLGMTITCESELVEIDGRKLVFSVSAKDEKGTVIGRGTDVYKRQVCYIGTDSKLLLHFHPKIDRFLLPMALNQTAGGILP